MKELIKKYMIEGDAITAWLIMKAPFLVALIYAFFAVKGDMQAVWVALFFFPCVYLLIKNLWLEIVHAELLTKLKTESGLEIEVIKKLFRITRFSIAVLGAAEIFLVPVLLNLPGSPKLSDIPLMMLTSLALIGTLSLFFFQVRFTYHIGKLLHVVETKRKFDPLKELNSEHRIRILNPVAFKKYHERIKKILK
ncbi:MAG: hypothetical protein AB7P01_18090 [Bacteroidia bacterium]